KSKKVHWSKPPQGWKKLKKLGKKERGKKFLRDYGCGGCHTIPGVSGAVGMVGTPLTNWKDRHYLAGNYVNNSINLIECIKNPKEMDKDTLMPNLDVSEEDAWDVASYLYSLKD